MHRTMS